EVGPRHSSWEAGEQSGAIRRGVGGAKGGDQGECEPAKHVPDAEPDERVTGAGAAYGKHLPSHTQGGSRMRESRTYGSVRGARDETRVPTATEARVHHAARRRGGGVAARGAGAAAAEGQSNWCARCRQCRCRVPSDGAA